MKNISPTISVITVVYNDCNNISKTLESVLSQDYADIEYIVIDGNSTDGTVDEIRKYRDNINYFISEPDTGIYDAMNKGLVIASGEYVIFMNSGDVFYDNHVLSKIFNHVILLPDVIYGKTIGKHRGGKLLQTLSPFFRSKSYCPAVGICHQSVLVKRHLAVDYRFDHDYKVCADHKMLYDLYKAGYKFEEYNGVISEIICDEGYSDMQLKLKLKERGMIIGIEKTLRFRVYSFVTFLFWLMRTKIRSFEPMIIKRIRYRLKTNSL